MKRRAFVAVAAGMLAAGWVRVGHAQRSAVRVTREDPVVERTEFDPRRPPRGMPPLTPP
jgi:hypothetical protein